MTSRPSTSAIITAPCERRSQSETITKVLYPNDEAAAGKQLRLEQQYFFTSCSLQDMIRIYRQQPRQDLADFHHKYAIQLNDTHPTLGIAELMRLLIDEHGMDWEPAWEITHAASPTPTIRCLPEALEKWPHALFAQSCRGSWKSFRKSTAVSSAKSSKNYPGDTGKIQRLSLIEEGGAKQVRMAHLACVGSHAVNGVAAIHTRLLSETVLRDFYDWAGEVLEQDQRRFVAALCWPGQSAARAAHHRRDRRRLDPRADELERTRAAGRRRGFCDLWRQVNMQNKTATWRQIIRRTWGRPSIPTSMFDMQVKRIHEYKRQHLNMLHVLSLYLRIKRDPQLDVVPRTVIFAGKAAPGYFLAKLIIKLINSTAQ